MICTALGKIDKQAKILEGWIGALNRELNMDIEAQSNDCSMADTELTALLVAINSIKAKSAEDESRKRGVANH